MNLPTIFKNGIPILFFLVCQVGFSQNAKVLQGIVVSDDGDVEGIAIQNTIGKQATITGKDGSFSILVRIGDTLVFSAVQFKKKELRISESIYNSSFLKVKMEEFVNELREVVVQPYNLSGNLDDDLNKLQLAKDVSAEALNLPNAEVRIVSQSENKLNDADNGKFAYFYVVALTINVNKILNRLNGRTRMFKDRIKLEKEYEMIQKIEEKYLDSVLVSYLNIPSDRFHDFFHYCQMDQNYEGVQKKSDELLLWEFLLHKSKAYREDNKLD